MRYRLKDLAPDITRKRLIIEGYFTNEVSRATIEEFFDSLCSKLSLRKYGEPIIFSPGAKGKEKNQGFDAFVPLIDSGISLYVWSNKKFFSCIIFTCNNFDEKKATAHTKKFFHAEKMDFKLF